MVTLISSPQPEEPAYEALAESYRREYLDRIGASAQVMREAFNKAARAMDQGK